MQPSKPGGGSGKIVIGLKKKKKPAIVFKKSDAASNAINAVNNTNGISANAANAVNISANIQNGTKISAKNNGIKPVKKSALVIKPYEKPPELPADFYDSNVRALRRATKCVLRHQPLLALETDADDEDDELSYEFDGSTCRGVNRGGDKTISNDAVPEAQHQQKQRLIGREDLYRSVEDLCVHKFGPRLYYDAVVMLDLAAREVIRRLVSSTNFKAPESGATLTANTALEAAAGGSTLNSVEQGIGEGDIDAVFDPVTGAVGFRASSLMSSLGLKEEGSSIGSENSIPGNSSNSTSDGRIPPSEKRYTLLRKMHSIFRVSYSEEYLTFVRSIFLALDRMYVFYAEEELEKMGNYFGGCSAVSGGVLKENDATMEDVDGNQQMRAASGSTFDPPRGKVMERSSHGSNPRIWSLWEVGIACLRRHMLRLPAYTSIENEGSIAATSSKTILENNDSMLSILKAMVLTTANAILSEYDGDRSNLTFSNFAIGDTQPLVRNCVRTCIDLASLMPLLEELIMTALVRFEREGRWWGMALNWEDATSTASASNFSASSDGTSAAKGVVCASKRTAPEFLLHVENRLKHSMALTAYYLPSNATSIAALRQLANRHGAGAATANPNSTSVRKVLASSHSNTRRILAAIVEMQLLSPHLVPTGVFHPQHLYPILDGDDGNGAEGTSAGWRSNANGKTFENAKRLYGLCWRMTASLPSPASRPCIPSSSSATNKNALDYLRIAFGEYGRLRGTEIVRQGLSSGPSSINNKELEKKVIPDLLSFKSHLQLLHALAFRSDEAFGSMLRSILEDILNGATSGGDGDGGRRIAELLAKHVDTRFKDAKAQAAAAMPSAASMAAGGTSSTVAMAVATDPNEMFQNEILSLFRHVHSKDVFEAFYKRDLAKRLLTGRSVSNDMEKSFLSKLKAECGAGYTSKMEGMFKDMELSSDIMSTYSAFSKGATNAGLYEKSAGPICPLPNGTGKGVEMDVQVLTTGYWPVYPKYPNIILPPEIMAHKLKFESYYKNKYQGRRIAWQFSLGNCIVKASFPKQPAGKELIVNVCQTLVLLCFKFNDGPDGQGLTIDDIMKQTGIDDRAEIERVLQSLSLGREGTRVLTKVDYEYPLKSGSEASSFDLSIPSAPSPTSVSTPSVSVSSPRKGNSKTQKKQKVRRNVGPHDKFIFNSSFTSNQRRIKITNITMKETAEERSQTHESVSKDRLYLIDAAVVRIMKARKTIDHRGLIGEVMAQLKFPASSTDVKKRIESLIEREYMERVEGDRSKYNYLA